MPKFIQDILYFSITTTGEDPEKDRILQLSAILLDKDNLLDKGIFDEYVRVSLLDGTLRQHAEFLGIEASTLQKSLKIHEALKKFVDTFGYTPLLACHQASDQWFLRQAFLKAGIPFQFDPHVLDIWSLGYYFCLKQGIKKQPSFYTFAEMCGTVIKNPQDAFERCQISKSLIHKLFNS